MRNGRRVFAALIALSLGTLACGLGGAPPMEEQQEMQEQAGDVQQQNGADAAYSPTRDECPVVTTDEVTAVTGLGVTALSTTETPEALLCTIGLEGGAGFRIQVTMSGGSEREGTSYESLMSLAVGEGSAVDGPWDEGMYFPETGLIFHTATNVVWIDIKNNQDSAMQVGTAVAGRLPYTMGG
jgi:hypothetical protein